ncbi:tigger transposable element-derived 6 [Brachionus plicatilis]|uniref:Tigger transposable element-derived 6 n=1 Tax=Brachionus plicatilis TaxID=10195 RepID=A0A3M7PJV9_BRAPC|nr:tigger transposable element-derived 6 [Brachionus plicatilis]
MSNLNQKKRKCISLETKVEIIKKHCEQKIATSILVNTSTISTILSSKEKILEHFEKNLCGTEKKRIKLSSFDDVDKAVLFWFSCCFGCVEIISSVNNTAQNDDSDSDVEEIEKPKKPVISSKEAIDKINDLKDFFLNKNQDFSKIVDFMFNIENVVIEKCNTKQTSIKDFVKKQ